MQPTQTSIAVALALVVVITLFIFPGLSPFNRPVSEPAAVGSETLPTSGTEQNTSMPSITPSGTPLTKLEIQDGVVGTGATAEAGDTVTVNYVGVLSNGTVFDASANHGNQGFTFKLGAGQVIKGWDQGVVGMKVGGKRLLAIPAALAYGSQGAGSAIPPNADLYFEVDLLNVQKAQ